MKGDKSKEATATWTNEKKRKTTIHVSERTNEKEQRQKNTNRPSRKLTYMP